MDVLLVKWWRAFVFLVQDTEVISVGFQQGCQIELVLM
jgi:hypothetical protein